VWRIGINEAYSEMAIQKMAYISNDWLFNGSLRQKAYFNLKISVSKSLSMMINDKLQ